MTDIIIQIIKAILFLFCSLLLTNVAIADDTYHGGSFEKYLSSLKKVTVNTRKLATCSAQYYAFAIYSEQSGGQAASGNRGLFKIKILSEVLYRAAIRRNKELATSIYTHEKEILLSQISKKTPPTMPKFDQQLCEKLTFEIKGKIRNFSQNLNSDIKARDLTGYWIDDYAYWEPYVSSRKIARHIELLHFERGGDVTLAEVFLYKDANKVIFDFEAPLIIFSGKWTIKDKKTVLHLTLKKNSSFRYHKIPKNKKIIFSAILYGDKLIMNGTFLSRLDTHKYKFIDNVNLLRKESKSELLHTNKILDLFKAKDELVSKVLRGDNTFTPAEKAVQKINLLKKYLDFTDAELRELNAQSAVE